METEAKLSDLPHKAVLLAATGTNDDYGNPTTEVGVVIDCRWEEGQQTTQQALATTTLNVATIFVDRYIPVNSLLWRGTWDDYNNEPIPGDMHKVVQYTRIDDVKGLKAEHRVLASATHTQIPV